MTRQKPDALRRWVCAGLLCLATGSALAASQAALEVGIFPYLSPRAVLGAHAPMKVYLETQLARPVNMSTAPGFKDIYERTRGGEYDLVILPPHLARLAQIEAGYVPVAIYSKVLKGLLVVRRDSPYQKVSDLAGKAIVAPDRLAIVTFIGLQYLREHGLQAGTHYTLSTSTSHSSAAYSVTQGEFDAVVTERAAFEKQIPEETRRNLRVLSVMGNVPHVMFMAHPRMGREQIDRLRAALLKFAVDSAGGRQFIEKGGWEGIRVVTDADMRALDVYMPELRRLLERAP